MIKKLRRSTYVFGMLLSLGAVVTSAQTTLAASAYGRLRSSIQTTSREDSTIFAESTAGTAGFSIQLRHIRSPLVGYEMTYSYQQEDENYSYSDYAYACPTGTSNSTQTCSLSDQASVSADAHEITGDWVFSFNKGKLQPFAIVGGGLLLTVPAEGAVTVSSALTQCIAGDSNPICTIILSPSKTRARTQIKGVFDYGVGLDWAIFRHIGFRFQYRGNVYEAPILIKQLPFSEKYTQDFEPEAGVFFRF